MREVQINTCQIDLQKDTLRTYWKDDQGKVFGKFSQLHTWLRDRNQHIVCATNAGIYDKQLQPLGMYVEQGRQLRRLNQRQNAYGNFYMQPNGVFMILDGQAKSLIPKRLPPICRAGNNRRATPRNPAPSCCRTA